MTRDEFRSALATLGLTTASKATAKALGLSIRQVQRIASGEQAAPETLSRLLEAYLRHGLPRDA